VGVGIGVEIGATPIYPVSAGCGVAFRHLVYFGVNRGWIAGATYTCPMHPQIRRDAPGNCPICGMTLEPLTITADAPANHELAGMTRRLWIGLALALPVFVLEMGGHIPWLGIHRVISPAVATWVEFVLSTPVVLWAGWPFFERAWTSVVNRSLNMFSLIALGTGAAYLYSVIATLAPSIFPAGFRRMDGTVAVYFEAAAVITVLVLLGQVLELHAREQTGGAIRALLNLAPKTARRVTAGQDEEIPLDAVAIGDRLRVRPGDGVPVDGVVVEGSSVVDESMVTGESMPAAKAAGDKLIGGTVNTTGSLVMQAEKIGADTMLARIVAMVSEAQRSRLPFGVWPTKSPAISSQPFCSSPSSRSVCGRSGDRRRHWRTRSSRSSRSSSSRVRARWVWPRR
jgi:Cu+-exporting ATPase